MAVSLLSSSGSKAPLLLPEARHQKCFATVLHSSLLNSGFNHRVTQGLLVSQPFTHLANDLILVSLRGLQAGK